MRLFALLFLPTVSAYVPYHGAATRSPLFTRPTPALNAIDIPEVDAINEITDDVSGKVQDAVGKIDDLVLKRIVRAVNHAPVLVTLSTLLSSLGSSKFGVDIGPGALSFITPAGLSVPTWVGYTIPILVASQAAAVVRSALADSDELSQGDISAMAVSNWAMTKALSSGSMCSWVTAAIASNYYGRNGGGSEAPSIKNLSIQVASSVSTAAAVLAVSTNLPKWIPFLSGQPELTAVIGLLGLLGVTTGDGNGKVKKLVNGAIAGGMLLKAIAGGALSLTTKNILSTGFVVTAATAYVAAAALKRANDAL